MQFSPTSLHFISLRSKYSQHPVFRHPKSVFLPQCERPSFTPTQPQAKLWFFILWFNIFRQQARRHRVLDWMVADITRNQSTLTFLLNHVLICYSIHNLAY
jgi:hypothetical protein